jgi:regulatory protein
MAGTITTLEYQKKNRDRVSVHLDGQFAFGLPAIVAARLRTGQYLSDAEVKALEEEGAIETAYNRVLNYLSYRPRSRAEVVTYLQRRDVPERQIEGVASRLEGTGLLDDEAFAQFWVENRERFRPRGKRALRYELRSKGIGDEVIDQVLASVDVSAGAYRAARKKARQLGRLDRVTFERKLVDYLIRRGFGYEVAHEAAERHWIELAAGE